MKYRIGILVLLLVLSSVTTSAQLNCKDICVKEEVADLIIDANTGEMTDGQLNYRGHQKIKILFRNKNPFKYAYRFNVKAIELDQAIISEGLGILGVTIPDAPTGPTNPQSFGACEMAGNPAKAFDDAFAKAETAEKVLADVLKMFKPAADQYDTFINSTREDSISCDQVCEPALELQKKLDGVLIPNVGVVDERVTALEKAVKAAREEHTKLLDRIKADVTVTAAERKTCMDVATPRAEPLAAIEKRLLSYQEIRTKALANKTQFAILNNIIRGLGPTSFSEVRHAVGPSEVTISTFRRNLREEGAKEIQATASPVKVTVGESRFSISGGIGWSSINRAKIVRQAAPDPSSSTGGTIEVFGEENGSHIQPQAVALVNARIGREFRLFKWKSIPASFGISSGVVILAAEDTSGMSYLLGPSLILNDNAFVVTLALHSANVARLSSGFHIGEKIPADIKGTLPVENNRTEGVMLAVTYRTRR